MRTKIDVGGKLFDPAKRARQGLALLRGHFMVEMREEKLSTIRQSVFTKALNDLADRLATCDAIEEKLERLKNPLDKRTRSRE